jgi:hypothetical protein
LTSTNQPIGLTIKFAQSKFFIKSQLTSETS